MLYREKRTFEIDDSVAKSLYYLIAILTSEPKYEAYLVGGCVRDLILNKQPNDFDICTSATPDQIKEKIKNHRAFKVWDSGLKHGTVTITNSEHNTSFEVTTFRIDGHYTDKRHPETIQFTPSLEEDLKRRDFTINSLAYDLKKDELIMLDESYLLDIKLKIIRTVGNAHDRFNEDALRMIRAIRFAAQLNGTIEVETFNAIKDLVEIIECVSEERIKDELTKIIISDNPQYLKLLILSGLDEYILPYLSYMGDIEQKNYYHYTDVLHHSLDVIKALPKEEVMLRWTALFHDMGKVNTVCYDNNGLEHHYGHEQASLSIAEEYINDFKFDNKTKNNILTIIQYHGYPLTSIKMKTLKKLINKIGEDLFEKYLLFRQADVMSHSLAEQETMLKDIADIKEKYKKIISEKHVMNLSKLAINGRDLIELGFEGREIGSALNKCLEYVLENPEDNHKEILINLIKKN